MKEIKTRKGEMIKVSDQDFDFLNQFTWTVSRIGKNRTPYALRREPKTGKNIFMHTIVFGLMGFKTTKKNIPDHRDLDGLNNQRENIRPSTYSQNCHNKPKYKKNASSQFKGVYFNPDNQNWRARIKVNFKKIEIGSFETEIEAAHAYNEKASELLGEFAFLNQL